MIDLVALRRRMEELAAPREYRMALTDEERINMEQTAWNYWESHGSKMKVAPRLFFDLANRGVNMKFMEPNGSIEAWGSTAANRGSKEKM
jgi:hypothetical protein